MLIGLIPAAIAQQKGRSFVQWWIYGALLFVFAIPHSLIMRADSKGIERRQYTVGMKKCPHCAEMIKGQANVCRYCNRDVKWVMLLISKSWLSKRSIAGMLWLNNYCGTIRCNFCDSLLNTPNTANFTELHITTPTTPPTSSRPHLSSSASLCRKPWSVRSHRGSDE